MAKPKIKALPKELRDWLDAELVRRGFRDYRRLAQDLQLEAKRRGAGAAAGEVSKSAVHRYGANLERRLQLVRDSTDAALLIAKTAPDDADQQSAAVMRILNSEIFNVLMNAGALNDETKDPAKRMKLLSSLASSVSKLARASVHQKKHEIDVRAKVELAADKVARLAKKGGASAATVESIKREVMGLAP